MHDATRLHFDFRLEFDGVFKSWAVPKGPSLNPLDQRLAVFVEDHPLDYGSFEGVIPSGNYGAGTVMIWDEGTYQERSSSDRATGQTHMKKGLAKGHLTFILHGEKLKGEFALIKLKKDSSDKAWLMVKKRDEFATYKRTSSFDNLSVVSGRTMDQISARAEKEGAVWISSARRKSKKEPEALKKPATKAAKTIAKPAQPRRVESMPRKNKPMLATASYEPVSGREWLIEPEVDGLRAMSEVEGRRVHLYSKSGLPFEKKFPAVIEA